MNKTKDLTLVLLLLPWTGACSLLSPPTPSPSAPVDTLAATRVDTVRVVTESPIDAELEAQVARLQIQVLEKQVQLEDLQEQLDATRQELVRTMAKLQSQASRAEAASGMAEAEIALEALRRVPGGQELPEYARAEERINESSREFNGENYGGALYLATEARALARGARSRLGGGGGSLMDGEALFALPVPLQTVGRSNVRRGPGLDHSVLFTLDGGSELVGRSHTPQWIRVRDGEGREGWIFHTLITGR